MAVRREEESEELPRSNGTVPGIADMAFNGGQECVDEIRHVRNTVRTDRRVPICELDILWDVYGLLVGLTADPALGDELRDPVRHEIRRTGVKSNKKASCSWTERKDTCLAT